MGDDYRSSLINDSDRSIQGSDVSEEEYYDDGHALPERNVSWLTAAQLMVVDIVGVGVLTLPSVMVDLGWVLGTIFIVLFYPLNVYCGMLLQRLVVHKSGKYKDVLSYMMMGQLVSGKSLRKFSAFVVYLNIFLSVRDYLLVLGQSFGLVFYDVYICPPAWLVMGCVPVFAFAQLRSFESMKWLMWFNMGTITVALVVTLGYVGSLGTDQSITPGMETQLFPPNLDALTFATAFSKIAFAYAGQFLYLEFMAEMVNPRDFPKAVYRFSGPYQVTVYLASALIGYHLKGQNATGLMVDWIPYNGWLRFGALMLFLHIMIIYVINANVLGKAIHRVIWPETVEDRSIRGKTHWFIINLGNIMACMLVALTIPFFDSLTGLIGALLMPIACWCLPIVYFYLAHQKNNEPISRIDMILMIFIFVLGIAITIVGTYSNMLDIVDNWATYGYPFTCGCTDVWNTCDCSPDHTGMVCPTNSSGNMSSFLDL